jgi:hypothetical protein
MTSENEIALLKLDGYDSALIGRVQRFNTEYFLYDKNKIIKQLVEIDGLTEEDAEEYFSYNIIGSWVGEGTPAFLVVEENEDNH